MMSAKMPRNIAV